MERTGVIIVAGGSGSRAGGARPKQFRFLDGMPVLARTINTFAAALPGAEIVAVLPEQHIGFWKNLSARFDVAEHKIAAGGAERFHSVRNGLAALTSDPGLIAVQDGVRPLGSVAMIRRVAEAAAKHGAAIPVVEPVDSFRETDGEADAAGRAAPCYDDDSRRTSSTAGFCASCRPRKSSAQRSCAAPTRANTARSSPTTLRWSRPSGRRSAWRRASAKTSNSQPPGISSSPKR